MPKHIQLRYQKWFDGKKQGEERPPLINHNAINEHIRVLKEEGLVVWGQFGKKRFGVEFNSKNKRRNYFSKENVDSWNNSDENQYLFLVSNSDFSEFSSYDLDKLEHSIKKDVGFLKTTEVYMCKIENTFLVRNHNGNPIDLAPQYQKLIPEYYNNNSHNYQMFRGIDYDFEVEIWFVLSSIDRVSLDVLNEIKSGSSENFPISEIESYSRRTTKRFVDIPPEVNTYKSSRTEIHDYIFDYGVIFPPFNDLETQNIEIEFDYDKSTFQGSTEKIKFCDANYWGFQNKLMDFEYNFKWNNRNEPNLLNKITTEYKLFENSYTMFDYSIEIYDEASSTNRWIDFVEARKVSENKTYCVTILSEARYKKYINDQKEGPNSEKIDKDRFVCAKLSSIIGSNQEVKCYIDIFSLREGSLI